MSTDIKSMFASIQSAMEKKPKADSRYSDIMSFKTGNTYLVRILPYIKDPTKTFFDYNMHSWNSVSTKQRVNYLCPSTFGLRSPITEEFFKLRKAGREEEAKHLSRQQNSMVNVYVINDPVNPENNGQVKILRYGKQLDKIIKAATVGDDAAEFGHRVFDLSENGCNFRIKVETTTESRNDSANKKSYPTYVSSRFVSPSAIPEMTKEKIDIILGSTFDLYTFFPSHTEDELKEALKVHFYGGSTEYVAPTVDEKKGAETKQSNSHNNDDDDDVPMSHPPKKQESVNTQKGGTKATDNDRVNKLLSDFDDV